ncbi:MAG TPA: hypothetical protein VFZ59_20560 [Verrucomicrobiae bacterium]|nr:hypothetical protein [Verrucomicrobiae bacterium]
MKSISSPPPSDTNRPVIRIASLALVACMLLAIAVVVISSKTSSSTVQPPASLQSGR